jgi:uncharacterized protein YdeI (YjbR/CyaY-like superfamily)
MSETKNSLPIMLFVTPGDWRAWLDDNHQAPGVWMRFYKKGKGESINYAQALDEALCYGWIDSQVAKYDDDSYLQKFTPRRAKSIWSKRNITYVQRLVKEGKMTPHGLKEIEAAKADGRWERAYDSPANMEIPSDLLQALEKLPKAKAFFETLSKANLYAIAWRLQTAKKEATRTRRMETILAMLDKGEKFH